MADVAPTLQAFGVSCLELSIHSTSRTAQVLRSPEPPGTVQQVELDSARPSAALVSVWDAQQRARATEGKSYSVPGYAVLQDDWISRHIKGWYGRESATWAHFRCDSGTRSKIETKGHGWYRSAEVRSSQCEWLPIDGSCPLSSSGGHRSKHSCWRSHPPSRFQHQSCFRDSPAVLWCFLPSSVMSSRSPHHWRGHGTWTHDWWIHAGVSIHRR